MGTSPISATLVATKPAAFNTNFQGGAVITVPSFGVFKIAANINADKIEFITYEDQTSVTPNKSGATYGSFDKVSGDAYFEARLERLNCTEVGSCGWNRHIRAKAKLTVSGGSPTDLQSISFAYANIQSTPGQSGFAGTLVTAGGDSTLGFKARLWQATNGSGGSPASTADYTTAGNWVETTNSNCYLGSSESATTCGTGVAGFTTPPPFLMMSTYTAASTWHTTYAGASYLGAVDVNVDTQ